MPKLPIPAGRRLLRSLELSPRAVFAIGSRGRLSYANRAWSNLTGCPLEEVLGRPASGVEPEPDRAGLVLAAFDAPPEAWEGRPCSARIAFPGAGGEVVRCRADFWPLADPDARHALILGIVGEPDRPALTEESPNARLRAELAAALAEFSPTRGECTLVGRGPRHRRLVAQVEAVAGCRADALIIGPAGSGRRHVAKAVHEARSPGKPQLCIDCEAVPIDRIGDEIRAAVEAAGTLVLHELTALPRDVQQGLLEFLGRPAEDRVQILSTSRTDPAAAVASGVLRADLHLGLSTVTIELAPLRERLDDLALLARFFLEQANRDPASSSECRGFAPGAIEVLSAYDWPGNLAELRRVVRAGHQSAAGALIGPADWPAEISGQRAAAYPPPARSEGTRSLRASLEAHERRLIERALRQARSNKSRAAQLLGLSRAKLIRRVKDLGIDDRAG